LGLLIGEYVSKSEYLLAKVVHMTVADAGETSREASRMPELARLKAAHTELMRAYVRALEDASRVRRTFSLRHSTHPAS
jgi:hypothetical protein